MTYYDTGKLPEKYGWKVRVCARGYLDYLNEGCFDDMKIIENDDGTSTIDGVLVDLPEVYGFIIRLRDALISLHYLQVIRIEIEGPNE